LATGIQTSVRRTRSRRQKTPRLRTQRRELVRQTIAPYRNLIFVFLCVLALTALHLSATPWERALGLAHGEVMTTPGTDFLVFDHVTHQGTSVLNRNLLFYTGGVHELVVVHGYGLWRLGLLLALCYALTLFLGRALLKIQVRGALTTGVSVDRRHLVLVSVLFGVMMGLFGTGLVFPTLFALAFFRVLVLANKSRPNQTKIAGAVELLDMTRAMWIGWLTPSLLTSEAAWTETTTIYLVGLLLGCAASYLFLIGLGGQTRTLLRSDEVIDAHRTSFEMGCLETLAVLAVCVLSYITGPFNLAGTVLLLGVFGYGRFAQSCLLRQLDKLSTVQGNTRTESAFRIITGVWFLLPLPLGALFSGYDQTALMLWLAVLVPLVSAGRPWGSVANSDESADQFINTLSTGLGKDLSALRPTQKAAILFMSLPPEVSAQLFSELEPEEVQNITLEITKLPVINPELREAVVNEFLWRHPRQSYARETPIDTLERRARFNSPEVAHGLKNMCGER
jgi:hypothetical protein